MTPDPKPLNSLRCLSQDGRKTVAWFAVFAAASLLGNSARSQDAETPSSAPAPAEASPAPSDEHLPAVIPYERVHSMIQRAPFGKPPAPTAVPKPLPVKQKAPLRPATETPTPPRKLSLAAITTVAGKPSAYLIDLETRTYHRVTMDEENELGIRLLEVDPATHPRDASAQVLVDGQPLVVQYSPATMNQKPKKKTQKPSAPPLQQGAPVSPAVIRPGAPSRPAPVTSASATSPAAPDSTSPSPPQLAQQTIERRPALNSARAGQMRRLSMIPGRSSVAVDSSDTTRAGTISTPQIPNHEGSSQ